MGGSRKCNAETEVVSSKEMSRTRFFKTIIGTSGVVATTLVQGPAVTNAAIDLDPLATGSAIRGIKRALKQLKTFEFYVTQSDYEALKASTRTPPISEVRTNCFAIVKASGYDENYEKSYKEFISNFEKLDSTASLGMRGRKVSSEDFLRTYQNTVTSLESFYELVAPTVN